MKKRSMLLLSIILAILLTACSNDQEVSSEDTGQQPETTSERQSIPSIPTLTPTIFVPTATSVDESGVIAVVTTDSANLRSGPSTNHNIIGTVARNQTMPIISKAYNTASVSAPALEEIWYQVENPEAETAWISASMVSVSPQDADIDFATTIPANMTDLPDSISRDQLARLYSGVWLNNDANTKGTTRIEIWLHNEIPYMHWYGSCQPSDCDNGIHSGSWEGNILYFFIRNSFAISEFSISYREDVLWLTASRVYKDNSGRLPYTSTEGFSQTQRFSTPADGWNIYLTDITESSSDHRGWKSVTFDMVFESTSSAPFPLYDRQRQVFILDSTGNWRKGGWGCSREVLRVPEGIRFMCRSGEIELPEIATIELFDIKACGSSDCDPDYAIYHLRINEVTPELNLVFPFDTLPTSVPLLADEPVEANIPDLEGAIVTFLPGIQVTQGDWAAIDFDITVENLTGNDLTNWQGNFYIDWNTTSIQRDGTVYVYEIYCETIDGGRYWHIPPGYTDTLKCHSVATFDESANLDHFWLGFSTGDRGAPFLQADING